MLCRMTVATVLTGVLWGCGGPPTPAVAGPGERASPAPEAAPKEAHPPAVGDRIELDVMLFEAGSAVMKPEADTEIREAVAGWPLWTLIQVESVSDSGPVLRPEQGDEVFRGRGEAVRRVLTRLGYEPPPVRTSVGTESLGRIRLTAIETAPRAGSRIDLGVNLFKSGSPEFAPGAVESIRAKVQGWPAAVAFDIEVYADSGMIHERRFGSREKLMRNRGAAVQRELESLGYRVGKVDPIGAQTRRGKAPSRRVELVAAGATP